MPKVIYRRPKLSDAKQLMNFINTASKEQTFIRLQGRQITLEEEEKYLKEFIADIEKRKAVKLFAFDGDELIGAADIRLNRDAMEHVGILGIVLKKEYRNQGIGSELLQKIISEAKQQLPTLEIITLGVFANNDRGLHVYKKIGFKQYGVLPKGAKRRGEYIDHIDMYLKIKDN